MQDCDWNEEFVSIKGLRRVRTKNSITICILYTISNRSDVPIVTVKLYSTLCASLVLKLMQKALRTMRNGRQLLHSTPFVARYVGHDVGPGPQLPHRAHANVRKRRCQCCARDKTSIHVLAVLDHDSDENCRVAVLYTYL